MKRKTGPGMPLCRADGDRYIVYLADGDRVGFIKRRPSGGWNAVDTFMTKSRDFRLRRDAAQWLALQFARRTKRTSA